MTADNFMPKGIHSAVTKCTMIMPTISVAWFALPLWILGWLTGPGRFGSDFYWRPFFFWPSVLLLPGLPVCSFKTPIVLGATESQILSHFEIVRTKTHRLFKLEPPNSDIRCKTLWSRSLLIWELIDLDLQGQVQLKVKISLCPVWQLQ